MAIEAPASSFHKKNLKIYIFACIIFAVVFGYDGYLSKYPWSKRQSFYQKHTKDGKPDETMMFNRVVPILLLAGSAVFGLRLKNIQKIKVIVGENELVVNNTLKIPYSSMQKIDKTNFSSKGYFIISYQDSSGKEASCKISDRKYDNLPAILEHLIAKIS